MSSQLISLTKQTQKTLDFRQKFKTERCRLWYEKGFCPFNKFCAFAHNEDEMREKKELNFKYKTKLCFNFFDKGFCKYGDRCQYLHKTLQQDKDGQKTRSNSEESYSSKSSAQERPRQSSINQNCLQSKHQNRYQMLGDKNINLLEIRMMGANSRIDTLLEIKFSGRGFYDDDGSRTYQSEGYSGLGSCQQKKYRMYSM